MSYPMPVIKLPNLLEQEKLIRRLYDIGYHLDTEIHLDDGGLDEWMDNALDEDGICRYPYLAIMPTTRCIDGYKYNPCERSIGLFTLVNSTNHFISYLSRTNSPVQV